MKSPIALFIMAGLSNGCFNQTQPCLPSPVVVGELPDNGGDVPDIPRFFRDGRGRWGNGTSSPLPPRRSKPPRPPRRR